ncbi:hypothetical protein HPB50_024049 [Hyalomma asiaticum]|uniref:Uncharacterized protein n=1 Tax=Hyalomma asiaticum TaxID=266040 RepID=A0ACB7SPJ5_HYAAI|nr:hypothetical protein HPB50_024049 [Hyalomma asiaticum]
MSVVHCLLVVALLAGYGGVLTSVNSQEPAECGAMCGGFLEVACVPMCHCVHYPEIEYGVCLAHDMNLTHLPPLYESLHSDLTTAFGLLLRQPWLSPKVSLLHCLLMTLLMEVHGRVLTSEESYYLANCGERCGGFTGRVCVDECHCVYYLGCPGTCLPPDMNVTHLFPHGPFGRRLFVLLTSEV